MRENRQNQSGVPHQDSGTSGLTAVEAALSVFISMARKLKKNTPIIEIYKIEVDDWEADYFFGLAPKGIIEGVYWEGCSLIITGKLISPVLDIVSKTKVNISIDPQVDDYWKAEPTIKSAQAIGWMEILRDNTLLFNCSVPSHSFPYLAYSVQEKKIKYISITGTKLRYKRGTIRHIALSLQLEDE